MRPYSKTAGAAVSPAKPQAPGTRSHRQSVQSAGAVKGQQRLELKPPRKPRGWWQRYAQRLEAEIMLERIQTAALLRRLGVVT